MSVIPSRIQDLHVTWYSPNRYARRFGRIVPMFMFALAFLLLPAGSSLFSTAESSTTVPLTEIVGVVRDDSVSIRTHNFPANTDFTVTMGPMGTRGINGYVVGTVNSGAGGSFDASFKIPSELYGSYQISIRLQSGGYYPYYSFNWFYNNTTGAPPPETGEPAPPPETPAYTGIPTFKIDAVKRNVSVTIRTHNFPAGQTFNVTMGPMGTRGINGIHVGTLDSGAGGALVETFSIPAELANHAQISIRAQTAHAYPYYAYNWFWNNDANVAASDTTAADTPADAGAGGQPTDSTTEADTGASTSTTTVYYGIPVITISSVVRDQEIQFQTHNYPANVDFSVTMGPMGTQGVNGIHVGDFNSGAGGSFPVTMPIPAELAGSYQISVRAQSHHPMPYAYYSYNWFYNNTTP